MPTLSRTVNNLTKLTINSSKSIDKGQLSTVQSKSKGFTLIELLVVISIIGILATFVVASFTGAQARGRDARRKSDLDALKKALELAKADSTGSAYYPGCNPVAVSCTPGDTNTSPALTPTYIRVVPVDPSGTGWNYTYTPATPASCGANACTTFTLRACLENARDPQAETTKVGCTGTGQNASYVVFNP